MNAVWTNSTPGVETEIFEGRYIVYNGNKMRIKMERDKMNLSKIHHIAIIVSDYKAANR